MKEFDRANRGDMPASVAPVTRRRNKIIWRGELDIQSRLFFSLAIASKTPFGSGSLDVNINGLLPKTQKQSRCAACKIDFARTLSGDGKLLHEFLKNFDVTFRRISPKVISSHRDAQLNPAGRTIERQNQLFVAFFLFLLSAFGLGVVLPFFDAGAILSMSSSNSFASSGVRTTLGRKKTINCTSWTVLSFLLTSHLKPGMSPRIGSFTQRV